MQAFSTVHGTPSEMQTFKVYGSTLKDSVKLNFSQKQHFEMRVAGSNDWKKQLALAIVDSILDTQPLWKFVIILPSLRLNIRTTKL